MAPIYMGMRQHWLLQLELDKER